MPAPYVTLHQQTLPGFAAFISSQESAAGNSPCVSPAGRKTKKSGRVRVRASRSPSPESEAEQTTNATCGPNSSDSLKPADLVGQWESRFRQRMDLFGSTVYSTTWKRRATPAGRSILALRASGRRTSDSDCIWWPSPTRSDTTGGKIPPGHANRTNITKLKQVTNIVGWCTPMAQDASRGGLPPRPHDTGVPLSQQVALTGWNTPRATVGSKGGPNQTGGALPADAALAGWAKLNTRDHKSDIPAEEWLREKQGQPLSQQALGTIPPSSTAETENPARSALNPAMSRWLMGFPSRLDTSSPGWASWVLIQKLLSGSSPTPAEIEQAALEATGTR